MLFFVTDFNMNPNNMCILCNKPMTEEDNRQLGQRAINTLITSSEKRKDKKHIELRKHSSITVHIHCLPQCNSESGINAAIKNKSESISKRRPLMKDERWLSGLYLVFKHKVVERSRRKLKNTGREINFNKSTKIAFSQEKFLSKDKNKVNLINMLKDSLIQAGFQTKIAEEDADVLIVPTAIEAASTHEKVLIYGQDIDLLVILT